MCKYLARHWKIKTSQTSSACGMGGLNKWVIFTSFIFQESQKYCGTTDCDPCLLESFIIILMIISIIRPICFVPKWEFCVLLNFMFRPPTVRPHLWPQARAGCYKIIVYSSPLLMTALLPTILSLLERCPLMRARVAYIHGTCYQEFVSFLEGCPL